MEMLLPRVLLLLLSTVVVTACRGSSDSSAASSDTLSGARIHCSTWTRLSPDTPTARGWDIVFRLEAKPQPQQQVKVHLWGIKRGTRDEVSWGQMILHPAEATGEWAGHTSNGSAVYIQKTPFTENQFALVYNNHNNKRNVEGCQTDLERGRALFSGSTRCLPDNGLPQSPSVRLTCL